MAEINYIRYETNTKGKSCSSIVNPFQKRMNIQIIFTTEQVSVLHR